MEQGKTPCTGREGDSGHVNVLICWTVDFRVITDPIPPLSPVLMSRPTFRATVSAAGATNGRFYETSGQPQLV